MNIRRPAPDLPEDRRATVAVARQLVSDNFVKTGIVTVLRALEGRAAEEIMERYYSGARSFQLLTKAASAPATTTTDHWASQLSQTSQGALAAIAPQAAFVKVLARCPLAFRFDRNRKIMVPTVGAAATDIGFVGEGLPLPVIAANITAATLEPRTFGCIAVFSREVFQLSLPNAEAVMRTKLASAITLSGDARMFDAVADDGVRPSGLLVGLSPLTASTATPLREAMRADVASLTAAVAVVAENAPIVLVANPKQANAYVVEYGRDAAFEMFASNALAAGTVIAIACNAIAHAVDPTPDLSVSEEAVVHADTVPQPLFTAATALSLWQAGLVGLKVTMAAAWARCSTNAVALMQSVSW